MNQQGFHLYLPPELYQDVLQSADDTDRVIEEELLQAIKLIYGKSASPDIDALKSFNDKLLWLVVHQRMNAEDEARLHELIENGRSGSLSDAEQAEMQGLIHEVNRQMLLRSEALLLLKQRGHDVEVYRASQP
jgi:hypothetical protein